MPAVDFRLYLVTDRRRTAGRPLSVVVQRAVQAGLTAIQLRERDLPTRALSALCTELQRAAPHATWLMNDRVDLALALGLQGVHLRERSLPTVAVRELLGPYRVIGRSVHSIAAAERAEQEGADFVVLGPIYATPSKLAYGAPLGLSMLRQAAQRVRIPIFAIGGITAERAREVRDAGGFGAAVISSILDATDVERATRELLTALA